MGQFPNTSPRPSGARPNSFREWGRADGALPAGPPHAPLEETPRLPRTSQSAKVALDAIKGELTVSQVVAR